IYSFQFFVVVELTGSVGYVLFYINKGSCEQECPQDPNIYYRTFIFAPLESSFGTGEDKEMVYCLFMQCFELKVNI
uniref:hypothetical protein n=1 Tax=Megasphaera sp. TaxID=2023260 RepID=UPI0027BAB6F4